MSTIMVLCMLTCKEGIDNGSRSASNANAISSPCPIKEDVQWA